MFLFSIAEPDYSYLKLKAGIKNLKELKGELKLKVNMINLKQIVNDVSPFLINPNDIKRIELFPEYIKNLRK